MNTAETIVAIIGGSFTAMSVLRYMGVRHSVKAVKKLTLPAIPAQNFLESLLRDTESPFDKHADQAVNTANGDKPGKAS